MTTLEQFKNECKDLLEKLQQLTYHATEEELKKKPGEDAWSALDCIDHLNIYNHYYLTKLKESLEKAKSDNRNKQTTWLGRYLANSMEPRGKVIPNKMKTFKHTQPAPDDKRLSRVVLQNYLDDLGELAKLCENYAHKSWKGPRIKTFLPLLTLRPIDALLFTLAHNRRHLVQAEKALANSK